jgi:hypothetical protein
LPLFEGSGKSVIPSARMHRADSSILPKPACPEPDDDLEPLVPDEASVVVEPMLATFGSDEPLPHPPRPRARASARAIRLTTPWGTGFPRLQGYEPGHRPQATRAPVTRAQQAWLRSCYRRVLGTAEEADVRLPGGLAPASQWVSPT